MLHMGHFYGEKLDPNMNGYKLRPTYYGIIIILPERRELCKRDPANLTKGN